MATAANSTSSPTSVMDTPPLTVALVGPTTEEAAAKSVYKRYEGLMTVRTKAIRGKGAWYWAHLEPILVHASDSGVAKAVKLRCSLCDAVFSASNPSRTASEHLKRGTCPNFASPSAGTPGAGSAAASPAPISAVRPCMTSSAPHGRKRPAAAAGSGSIGSPNPTAFHALAIVDPSQFSASPTSAADVIYSTPPAPPQLLPLPSPAQPAVVLSGGKEDLGALAMLEDSVKRLKSPKASPGPTLSRAQIESATSLLSDWLYECFGSGALSLSSVEQPRFRSFMAQVGLPQLSCRELVGPRMERRYDECRAEANARIRDALFFQLAADGWKARESSAGDGIVCLSVNLPNGTTVFHRAVAGHAHAPSQYAEEVLWDTVIDVCRGGGAAQRCAGIVSDRFKGKALRQLENQNHWMVNVCCQVQGFYSLIKDFARELPLFHRVAVNCCKLASYFNCQSQVRSIFQRYQSQEHDHVGLLRVAPLVEQPWRGGSSHGGENAAGFAPVYAMLDDILSSSRAVQLVVLDESYKLLSLEDPNARELGDMIRDMGFWNELDAVHSLVKLVKDMVQEMELERPLLGQCLPLWDELQSKVKDWWSKFNIEEGPVIKLLEKRFKKNYHPAWSAAYILDPLYLIKDSSGKYLPPFKFLTPDQEKDVDRLITRLVSREEAHIALMELMKWRTEGLDPLYAKAVQVKKLDPMTGKMRSANPQSSRLVWETYLSEFKSLGRVAVRLIFLNATSCSFKCNPSLVKWVHTHGRSRISVERAHKLLFIAANAKLERRDFMSDEEKDAELFTDGEDDVLNEPPYVETHHPV